MNPTELRLRAIELGQSSPDPWVKVFARWLATARPDQLAPAGDWLVWFLMGGRGSGKTRTGAEHVTRRLMRDGYRRAGLIARTAAHVRDEMVEGPAGVMACSPPTEGRPVYEPSKRQITYPNGAIAKTYSAEEPSLLRGPEHDLIWADELASWGDAYKGDTVDTTWNNAMLGLRRGPHPEVIVTTTPKRVKLLREIRARPLTVVTNATTYANLANLAPTFRDAVLRTYEGTRLGRQELGGELLEDVEGALWREEDILRSERPPALSRVVVAVDPSGTKTGDEIGIVGGGRIADRGYVLADASGHYSPEGWGRKVVGMYHDLQADKVVAEANYGGEMVIHVIRAVDPTVSVKVLHASRGKLIRAEPVAAMYEQGRWFHCGVFPLLEEEMLTWTPDDPRSPNRLDALVWLATELLVERSRARLIG